MIENKPTPILDAQERVNQASAHLCEIHDDFLSGRISLQSMEDAEQAALLARQAARTEREEATGRVLGRPWSFKDEVVRFLFG